MVFREVRVSVGRFGLEVVVRTVFGTFRDIFGLRVRFRVFDVFANFLVIFTKKQERPVQVPVFGFEVR